MNNLNISETGSAIEEFTTMLETPEMKMFEIDTGETFSEVDPDQEWFDLVDGLFDDSQDREILEFALGESDFTLDFN